MNKKLFIGATVVTAAAVAGYLYYRHVSLDTWEQAEEEPEHVIELAPREDPEDG